MILTNLKFRSSGTTFVAIALALMLFNSTPLHATGDVIYYWLDKTTGVPKYSETPPRDGQKYQTILPKVARQHDPKKEKEQIKSQQVQRREKRLDQHEQHQQSIASAEIRKKNCIIVTKRLNGLKNKSRVSLQYSDGSIKALSEDERQEQIQIAQSQSSQYCN